MVHQPKITSIISFGNAASAERNCIPYFKKKVATQMTKTSMINQSKITNIISTDKMHSYAEKVEREFSSSLTETSKRLVDDIKSFAQSERTLRNDTLNIKKIQKVIAECLPCPIETKEKIDQIMDQSLTKIHDNVQSNLLSLIENDLKSSTDKLIENEISNFVQQINDEIKIPIPSTFSKQSAATENKKIESSKVLSNQISQFFDFGDIDLENLSDSDRKMLAISRHIPIGDFVPKPYYQKQGLGIDSNQIFKKRLFSKNLLEMYSWAEFSQKENNEGVFCKPCALYWNGKNKSASYKNKRFEKFVKSPANDYSKIANHMKSHDKMESHKLAMSGIDNLIQEVSEIECTLVGKIDKWKSVENAKMKRILSSIIDVIKTLGKQNLAFRGHRDSGNFLESDKNQNLGNFKAVLQLLSSKDTELFNHFEEGSKNAQYTSPKIQNEILNIISMLITSKIAQEIRDSFCFAISFDETPDVTHKEQMVLTVRYIDNKGKVKERFMGFYDCYSIAKKLSPDSSELKLDGKTVAAIVTNVVSKLSINHKNKCVSISTDGAATLSGRFNGAVKNLQEGEFPLALWSYCMSHMLDLCVGGCFASTDIAIMINTINKIKDFFNSDKCYTLLESFIDRDEHKRKLILFSKTRQIQKFTSIERFLTLLSPIKKALVHIKENWVEVNAVLKANTLLALIDSKLVASVISITNIMAPIKDLAISLQAQDLNVIQGFENIKEVIETFEDALRHDVKKNNIRLIVNSHREICKNLDLNQKILSNSDMKTNLEVIDERLYTPLLENFIIKLKEKFDNRPKILKAVGQVLSKNIEDDTISEICEFYHSLIAPELTTNELIIEVKKEINIFRKIRSEKPEKFTSLEISKNLAYFHKILLIANTIIISNAQAERMFSKLNIIKSNLRNASSQQRLLDLSNLSTNRDLIDEIHNTHIIDLFVSKKDRKGF